MNSLFVIIINVLLLFFLTYLLYKLLKKRKIEFIKSVKQTKSLKQNDLSYKIRKRYFFWENVLIVVGLLFSYLLIILTIYKMIDIATHSWDNNIADINKNFDVAGIVVGIVGIVIGVYIAIAVENNNEQKSEELIYQLSLLDEQTNKIKNINENIKSRLTDLIEHPNLIDRLKGIQNVIKHAQDNDNHLYILSYAPIHGQFIMCNAKVILTDCDEIDYINLSQQKFYREFIQVLQAQKNANKYILSKFASDKSEKLHLALLKSDWIDSTVAAKFKNFVQSRIIRDSEIVFINNKSDGPLPDLLKKSVQDLKNVYIHLHNEDENNMNKRRDIMIDDLISLDKKYLSELTTNKDINLYFLDYIPFQFFISFPDKAENRDSEYLCLITFTNYYDLGQDHSAVSFSSENSNLCVNLKDMFDGLIRSQDEKDKLESALKSLFKSKTHPTLKIVLKSVDAERSHQFPKYRSVTPVVDIIAKDKLLESLNENEVKHATTIEFLHEKKLNSFLEDNSIVSHSLFSIGLFFNPLSELLGKTNTTYQHGSPAKLFKLNHVIEQGENSLPKNIDVALSGMISEHDKIEYQTFHEVFNDKLPTDQQFDYAIFCKQVLSGRPIFIFGGINFFASQHVDKCLSATSLQELKGHVVNYDQYVAVFEVNSGIEVSSRLIIVSVVSSDGQIINVINNTKRQ